MAALPAPAMAQQFREVTGEVNFVQEASLSSGNPVWGDINNDDFLDLIVPTASPRPFVYLNNGGNTFTDIRATSGIEPSDTDSPKWRGFAFGDYDADRNLDLYIAENAGNHEAKRDLLFRGRGDGSFENVSEEAGIETSTALGFSPFWLDYDNNGLLDLFVKNYGTASRLYQNNGDRTFTMVDNAAGLADATLGDYHGTVCSFADYDNSRFMDVIFSGLRNALYKNDAALYSDASAIVRIKTQHDGKGVAWGDYDNDGFLDLYIARVKPTPGRTNTLYHNNGDGTFLDLAEAAGVAATDDNTWAPVWGDYDNDGLLDLFVSNIGVGGTGNANFLYRNNGNGTFTDRAPLEGVALEDNVTPHQGAAWADFDNDGFLDLVIKDGSGPQQGLHRLFRNRGNRNHFIKITLVGVQSNIRGIGARVTLTTDQGTLVYRENNGGGGGEDSSQGSQPLHFGIGRALRTRVKVNWPSGTIDSIRTVPADSRVTIVEGSTL